MLLEELHILDVLSRNEICKIMTMRIIEILKGQSADISFDEEDDDDQLLEEVLEEDDYEETGEVSDESDESEYEDFLDDDKPTEDNNTLIHPDITHRVEQSKASIPPVRKEIKKEEPVVAGPLNWFEETGDDELPEPEYITYGCWVKVLDEKNNKEIIYHIPLKDDHSRAWYGIEEKMMGQDVGFRLFLAGRHYSVVEFGRDDERKDTRAEFKSRED